MAAFADGIDRFVRWFFNSSPVSMAIESRPSGKGDPPALARSERLLRHGVLAGAAMVALVLLLVFYSVVAGAVDRAAQRRTTPQVDAALSTARPAHRPAAANIARADKPAFAPRSVSYLRSTN